ncbi:MAG: DUF4115 domain-containing protein [Candidatus Omnitrophica bacterium]|nr:DUF4115 domain-containing protein [Candidatus Omnitrophota bacterium]
MTREEFIDRLKTKRRQSGLNLEEVVDKTKIPPSAIKRLESGRWEEMNPLYLKGFLKIYCAFLKEDLDEELLKERRPYVPDTPMVKAIQRTRPQRQFSLPKLSIPKIKIPSIPPHLIRIIISVLLTLALVWAGIWVLKSATRFIVSHIRSRKPPRIITHSPVVPVPAPVATPVAAVPAEKPKEVPAQVPPPVKKEELSVTLTAKRDCFVKVKREGTVIFEGILRKGAVENWQAKKELEFKLSDGTAIDVEVNGQILPALTKIKKPIKSLKITPTGIFVDK